DLLFRFRGAPLWRLASETLHLLAHRPALRRFEGRKGPADERNRLGEDLRSQLAETAIESAPDAVLVQEGNGAPAKESREPRRCLRRGDSRREREPRGGVQPTLVQRPGVVADAHEPPSQEPVDGIA